MIVKDEIVKMWKTDEVKPRRNRSSSTRKMPVTEPLNITSKANDEMLEENEQIDVQNSMEEKNGESSEVSSTKEDSGFDETEAPTGVSTPLHTQSEDMQPEPIIETISEISQKAQATDIRSPAKNTESRRSRSRSPKKSMAKLKEQRINTKEASFINLI